MTQFTSTYINGTIDEITLASGSLSFGGTNYLNVPSSAQVTLGTGDFTIEFWIYLNNTTQNGGAFQLSSSSTYLTSSATNQLCLQLWQGYFQFGNNGGFNQGLNDATCAYSANTWYHIAMCRQSGILRYFVNGTQKLSNVSDTTNYTGTYLGIGRFFDTPYGINGYLSNFRLTKGTALYTSNFNVPQGPLPNITNTSLLLNVQPSNSFKDSSTNNFTLTNSGVTFTNVGPFNPAPPASGTSQNIPMRQFRDGTIMISGIYDEVGSSGYVSSGLISYLDASVSASYPGTGTTWYDISGSGNNGTLVNSPTFNSTSGGNFVLNGSNQYITAPLTKTATCTFSLWAKAVNVTQPMLFIAGNSGSGPDLFFYSGVISWNTWDGTTNQIAAIPASATNGSFHNYVLVNDSVSNTAKLYYDGSLLGTATYKNASATTVYTIGGDPSYLWNGSIANSMVYNRALTADEVTTNFTYFRTRFGI